MCTSTPPLAKYSRTNGMISGRYIAAILAIACLSTSTTDATGVNHNDALELRRSGLILPFEDILGFIYKRYPDAFVVEVELEDDAGALVYEIEIYTASGQLRELELDARDGRILDDELED